MAINFDKIAEFVNNTMESGKYRSVGFRRVDERYLSGELKVGIVLPNSYSNDWNNMSTTYDTTKEQLNGVSAIYLETLVWCDENNVADAYARSCDYQGTLCIVAGGRSEIGEDENEIIIPNAQVIWIEE
jgi:hypothetical protein